VPARTAPDTAKSAPRPSACRHRLTFGLLVTC
jgi:hypothetical protein